MRVEHAEMRSRGLCQRFWGDCRQPARRRQRGARRHDTCGLWLTGSQV